MPSRSRLASTGFFRLWAAESISFTGAQVTTFALPLIAVISLDASAWQTSMLVAAGTAANLVLGLSVGVWADRYERRSLMHIANIGRLLALLLVPVLWWADALNIGVLLGVTFTVGALSLLFDSAMSPYVSRLVGRDQLGPANSWMQGSEAVGDVAGPGLAGLLVQVFGAPVSLLVDAVSYLVSSAALMTLPKAEPNRSKQDPQERHLAAIGSGLKLLRDDRIQRPLALASTHFNLFGGMFAALYALYAVRVLGFSPAVFGALTMLGGAAGLIGASLCGRLRDRFGVGPTLICAYALPGVTGLLVGAADSFDRPVALVLVGIAQFSWVFGVVLILISNATLRQALVPDHQLGRITATVRFLTWGVEPLGALLAGALAATVLDLTGTLVLAAAGVACSVVWLLPSSVRSMRTMPEAPEESTDTDPDAEVLDGTPAG